MTDINEVTGEMLFLSLPGGPYSGVEVKGSLVARDDGSFIITYIPKENTKLNTKLYALVCEDKTPDIMFWEKYEPGLHVGIGETRPV